MKSTTKSILVAGVILIALVIGGSFLMGQYHWGNHWDGDYGYHGHMMGFSSAWGWIMMLMMLLFWGLIVWAVIWGTRNFSRTNCDRENRAMEILKRRYAAGEVNKEEFESRKRDLME